MLVELLKSGGYGFQYAASGYDGRQAGDSYASLDFAFYCMENGRVQIYELGELRHTLPEKFSPSTTFQVRIVSKAVEYVVDDKAQW